MSHKRTFIESPAQSCVVNVTSTWLYTLDLGNKAEATFGDLLSEKRIAACDTTKLQAQASAMKDWGPPHTDMPLHWYEGTVRASIIPENHSG